MAAERDARKTRMRKIFTSTLLMLVLLGIVAGRASADWSWGAFVQAGEDILDGDAFDGDCTDGPDLVPACDLNQEGAMATNEPACMLLVAISGLHNFAPTDATFEVSNLSSWTGSVKSVSWRFDDGTMSIDPQPGDTFVEHFDITEGGERSVEITAKLTSGETCKTTKHFQVKEKPSMSLTSSQVQGQPLRVALHATATVDGQPWQGFNWDFGGGTPVGCPGWCNVGDVVVEFPQAGTYQVTATVNALGSGTEQTITVQVGESEPQPYWAFPDDEASEAEEGEEQPELAPPPVDPSLVPAEEIEIDEPMRQLPTPTTVPPSIPTIELDLPEGIWGLGL